MYRSIWIQKLKVISSLRCFCILFKNRDLLGGDQLYLQLIRYVPSQTIGGSQIIHGSHISHSSHQILWSTRHLSLGRGGCSGLMGAVPQSNLGASIGCGQIGHWPRDCPKYELDVKIGSSQLSRRFKSPKVWYDFMEDSYLSRECP